jgi:hypothetical protein
LHAERLAAAEPLHGDERCDVAGSSLTTDEVSATLH